MPITLERNKNLAKYNTFGIEVYADIFIEINNIDDLVEFIGSDESKSSQNILIIGGGSNVLFRNDFKGTIIYNNIKGIQQKLVGDKVILRVGAGENWHELVKFTIDKQWSGFENLALIPGNTGAVPVQNIGAYGVEIAERIVSVEGVDIKTGEKLKLNKNQCAFGYRDSIFKNSYKDKNIITFVEF